ncbi:MAG: hypothetical protein WC556_11160 [Candidatus Methanoperedens sp.]
MKQKTVLIIGILATIMVLGAALALAQNSSEKKKDTENHECTPEMMKDMSKNCPEQMMKSGECKNMMDGEKGHSGMMGNEKPLWENTGTASENQCGDMGSDMGSGGTDTKSMM